MYAHEWITGSDDTYGFAKHAVADFWTDNLLDTMLRSDNLNAAYKRVKANKGAGGIDGMQVGDLLPYLREHRDELVRIRGSGRHGMGSTNPARSGGY